MTRTSQILAAAVLAATLGGCRGGQSQTGAASDATATPGPNGASSSSSGGIRGGGGGFAGGAAGAAAQRRQQPTESRAGDSAGHADSSASGEGEGGIGDSGAGHAGD